MRTGQSGCRPFACLGLNDGAARRHCPGSSGFSQLLAATGATSALVAAVAELDLSPLVTVVIMQRIVLLPGCFIDTISIMLVAIPVFMPVVLAIGVDPIWFCILILAQLELAGITPPLGVLPLVMKGVQQKTLLIVQAGMRMSVTRRASRADRCDGWRYPCIA